METHILDSSMDTLIWLWGLTALFTLFSLIYLLKGRKYFKHSAIAMLIGMLFATVSAIIALIDFLFL